MPKIERWVNGKLVGSSSLTVSRGVASVLKANGWEVHELWEIGMLVLFSPKFGTEEPLTSYTK